MTRKNILWFVAVVLLVILLEIFFVLMIPSRHLTILSQIQEILKEDQDLFWRQEAGLDSVFQGKFLKTNSLGLRNREIREQKDPQTVRIVCLGASPTFGWGVESTDNYPYKVEKKLNKAEQKFEVINAGQIGYSTFQGIAFFKKYLLSYQPDIVTVSYILNDIDRYRFYRNEGLTDKELSPGNFLGVTLRNFFLRRRLSFLFKRTVLSVASLSDRFMMKSLKRQYNLAKVRVPLSEYELNLEKMVYICSTKKIKLIFMKMPVNLSLPKLNDQELEYLKDNENLSLYYYNQGCDYEKKEDYRAARQAFEKARNCIAFDCQRESFFYQKIMGDVARRNKLPLIDVALAFTVQRGDGRFFNGPSDPIHPSPKGHTLIAELLYDEIVKEL